MGYNVQQGETNNSNKGDRSELDIVPVLIKLSRLSDMSFIDSARECHISVNGIDLCYFEWGEERRDDGATLFFVHANGYHARSLDQIIKEFAGYHVISVDQRGHGRSEKTLIKPLGYLRQRSDRPDRSIEPAAGGGNWPLDRRACSHQSSGRT